MGWASLASAPYNEETLLDSVVATSGIADIYSMQCCGWDGATSGSGTLVLGGVDASLYSGTIAYMPVTDQTYFCVTMTSPGFDDDSSCTNGASTADRTHARALPSCARLNVPRWTRGRRRQRDH